MTRERFRSHSGDGRERFALARTRVRADLGIKGAGEQVSRDWSSIQDQSGTVTVGVTLTRGETWLLVLAGLSQDERMGGRAKPAREVPARRALALASPEMSRLQRWFEKFIRESEGGCWIWTGARFRSGYGAAGWQGSTTVAHRLVWRFMVGDPGSLDLDHLCRVRACVNPDHLEPVSRSVNLTRGAHPTQGRLGRAS